jgi:ribosomal protein S12 methylthiotransferase
MPDPNLPTVALVSLGCPKNLVDSERMLAGLALAGFAVTDDADGADLALVNTCAFIDLARAESDREIDRLEDLKRAGRLGRILVVGCMAQRYGRRVLERHPGVDAVAGLAERDRLADLCGAVLASRAQAEPLVRVGAHPPAAPADRERLRLTPRHYTYLRITEGCDNRCAYCAIPEIRGPLRSKPPEEVLAEAREMVADGARELVLIGQDTTAYGRDRSDGWTLARLLGALRREAGAEWIRLLYTHPASFSGEVIEELAAGLPLVPYVDMPIQHADDALLASMGRRVTRAGIEDLVGRLRAAVPGIALRTTFIVGYPGETEAAFGTLLEFVEKVRFDHVGGFLYSREPGTRAAGLEGQVPRSVALRRWDRLTEAAGRPARESALRQVGRILEVRVDGPSHVKGRLAARHAGQAPEIDSVVLLAEASAKGKAARGPQRRRLAPGDRLRTRIVATDGTDLVGEPLRGGQPGDPTP